MNLDQFIDAGKAAALRGQIAAVPEGLVLVVGTGAANLHAGDVLIVADMPRWEGQNRQRRNEVSNLGVKNNELKASLQYKRSFFIDWRVGDRWKKPLLDKMDFLLDTTDADAPKLCARRSYPPRLRGLYEATFSRHALLRSRPLGRAVDEATLRLGPDDFQLRLVL